LLTVVLLRHILLFKTERDHIVLCISVLGWRDPIFNVEVCEARGFKSCVWLQ